MALRGHVAGVYVAVVQVRNDAPEPHYRRRVYLALAPAQRAVDRATMDGLEATVFLCRLEPVDGGGAHA
ncbi:hypothetical protein ACQ3I4_11245 [Zafaria sp. Z1313]|uniref:hypothetical protein n=1 Tax=Zafaria sp. Z1313 TaxID=3423202 RepID=UPI003D302C14